VAQREYTITELSRSRTHKASLSLAMARRRKRPTRYARLLRRCPRFKRSLPRTIRDYKLQTEILARCIIRIYRKFNTSIHRQDTTYDDDRDFEYYFKCNCSQLIKYFGLQLFAINLSIKRKYTFNPWSLEEPEDLLYIPPTSGSMYQGISYLSTSTCRHIFDNPDTYGKYMFFIEASLYEIMRKPTKILI
jgi:hypothetical protein